MSSPFYRTPFWGALRKEALRRDGGRCTHPGCGARGTHVDHIRPRPRADGPTPADVLGNLTTLCRPCHSRKTAARDGGFGNAPSRRSGAGEDGRPTDPRHPWVRAAGRG
jgi:5-methylcytosine-specific restriction protein A